MMLTPHALKLRIAEGIMAFPATPFRSDGSLDLSCLESHVSFLAQHSPTALVAAGGAGEIFSLSLPEHAQVMAAAVRSSGEVPVIGGAGYGTSMACEMARAVEAAGADGVLLFPPYLVRSEQEGLFRHISAVCSAVSIAVIPYSRDNAIIAPETLLRLVDRHRNLIALKDGTGDPARVGGFQTLLGDRIAIINGAPTAEVFAQQYQAASIISYSSAVFTFLPLLARHFYEALRSGNQSLVSAMLKDFYKPLVELRDRKHGYSVSIVKAGLRVAGTPAGPVRPPLVDLDSDEEARLASLVAEAAAWNR
jgi:5-dehydro-4-deoxyglucarate dehydratase